MSQTRHGRTAVAGLVGGVIGALALMLPNAAAAQYAVDPDPMPQEVLDIFADCPELPEEVNGLLCLNLTAYDGELKLGGTTASVDEPIEEKVAIGLDGLDPVIVPAEGDGTGGGGDAGINVPGGILGIPELDPILEQDPLGVLTVSASPELGEPIVGRPGQDPLLAGLAFLGYSIGFGTDDPDGLDLGALSVEEFLEQFPGGVGLGLPLSIKLNNLLFGDNCQIGTPEDPFVINLTHETTEPPEGVDPLTGEFGQGFATLYDGDDSLFLGANSHGGIREARFVDNTFAVPGAEGCDLLPGELKGGIDELEDALGIDTGLGTGSGLFDPVINEQVGLPAPAGVSRAEFSIDIETIPHQVRHPEEEE